jgi:hypothetical protein
MIDHLRLRRPIFRKSATYGHFGREDLDFTSERVDTIDEYGPRRPEADYAVFISVVSDLMFRVY